MDGLKYIIARANNTSDLETVVRDLLTQGYKLAGGVAVEVYIDDDPDRPNPNHYCQALYLE